MRVLGGDHLERERASAVGVMVNGIAHDFNNLLCAILSFAKFSQDEMCRESQGWSDINEVIKAAERASALNHQLLTFSRVKEAAAECLDLNRRLSEMSGIISRLLGDKIKLRVTTSSRPAMVLVDPVQFDQVVLNLVLNARDAMLPAGGGLTISLDQEFPGDERVVLRVQDTGQGMDSSTLRRIFEPFFTTKKSGAGNGLGLATCQTIVNKVGGQIWVESSPGAGATFSVSWPRLDDSLESTKPTAALALSESDFGVLVVEDEEPLRRVCKRILEKAGYRVHTAEDGLEALSKLAHSGREIHLVVTDLVMPNLSGLELARRIYERYPHIRILFSTGHPEKKAGVGCLDEGTFLWKPFRSEQLLSLAGRLLSTPSTPNDVSLQYRSINRTEDNSPLGYEVSIARRQPQLRDLDATLIVGAKLRQTLLHRFRQAAGKLDLVFLKIHSCELLSGCLLGSPLGQFAPRIVLEVELDCDAEEALPTRLWELRELGYRFAFSNVGRAVDKWERLQALRPEFVKLAFPLTRDIDKSPFRAAIAGALIEAAHRNGIRVIGAGVETRRQRDVLAGQGCDLLQGPLISSQPV